MIFEFVINFILIISERINRTGILNWLDWFLDSLNAITQICDLTSNSNLILIAQFSVVRAETAGQCVQTGRFHRQGRWSSADGFHSDQRFRLGVQFRPRRLRRECRAAVQQLAQYSQSGYQQSVRQEMSSESLVGLSAASFMICVSGSRRIWKVWFTARPSEWADRENGTLLGSNIARPTWAQRRIYSCRHWVARERRGCWIDTLIGPSLTTPGSGSRMSAVFSARSLATSSASHSHLITSGTNGRASGNSKSLGSIHNS